MILAEVITMKKRIISVLLSALVLFCGIPFSSYAETSDKPYVIRGTYSFTSNEAEINQQGNDTFEFREECFMRSSYLGCSHLMTLSAQAAISSASRWGDEVDPDQSDDPSGNAENVIDLLTAMGFSDVETNKYYTLEKQENSAAAAVAHRRIEADGKTYTLLAVIPRSANYKQEWAGNFTVGNGDYHDGFKQGRDEILRFVKSYLSAHDITGALKVWIAGHSRGAALANSLGGFFACGGASYLEGIELTPDNVYCYTFATPRTVKNGVSKRDYLSVSGSRGEPGYINDTPGEEYIYPGDGQIDPSDPLFDCVRNYPLPYDFITMLPPEGWGFTYFGKVEDPEADGRVNVAEMLEKLNEFAPFAYERFISTGDFRSFGLKTFDFLSLSAVDYTGEGGETGMAEFMRERIRSLTYPSPDNVIFVSDGYEDTLRAVAGLYGMLHSFSELEFEGAALDELIKPLVFCYLAYGAERLKAEDRLPSDASDAECASAVICDLLSYMTGGDMPGDTPMDEAVTGLLKFLVDNGDSKLTASACEAIAGILPTEGFQAIIVGQMIDTFVPEDAVGDMTKSEKILETLKACVYGPAEGSPAASQNEMEINSGYDPTYTPENIRSLIYALLSVQIEGLSDVLYGQDPTLSDLLSVILVRLLVSETDDDGNPLGYYDSLEEAANATLEKAVEALILPAIEKQNKKYGDQFDEQIRGHLSTLLTEKSISNLRRMITYLLFYSESDSFGTESSLRNALTFISNAGIIPLAHYNEVNIAWGKALAENEPYHAPVGGDPKTGDSEALTLTLICLSSLCAACALIRRKRRAKYI